MARVVLEGVVLDDDRLGHRRHWRNSEVADVEPERIIDRIDLGLQVRLQLGCCVGPDLIEMITQAVVDNLLRLTPPPIGRLAAPPRKAAVVERFDRILCDLPEEVGLQLDQGINLGLLDTHRRLPVDCALLRRLQRRLRQAVLANLIGSESGAVLPKLQIGEKGGLDACSFRPTSIGIFHPDGSQSEK